MPSKEPKVAYNRAPIFDGENYDYWKECMRFHIQSVDMDVWDAVDKGWFQPQIAADGDNGLIIDKPKVDWSDDGKKKFNNQKSMKLMSIISYLILRHPQICGMHWKPFTKEPMKLNNQKSIPLFNNMSFSAWPW